MIGGSLKIWRSNGWFCIRFHFFIKTSFKGDAEGGVWKSGNPESGIGTGIGTGTGTGTGTGMGRETYIKAGTTFTLI